jgi:hypothetical protein
MQDMVGMAGIEEPVPSLVAGGSIGHSGMVREHQTRNLEIPGSMLRIAPE